MTTNQPKRKGGKIFISSIGLRSGERNTEPQPNPNNSWKSVDWFLHTWGFLPNDETQIKKLDEDKKADLILLLLDLAWREYDNETSKRLIRMVQGKLSDWGLDEYFLK